MSAGILKRALACMLLAALSLSAAGCTDWEELADPLGELSDFYRAGAADHLHAALFRRGKSGPCDHHGDRPVGGGGPAV